MSLYVGWGWDRRADAWLRDRAHAIVFDAAPPSAAGGARKGRRSPPRGRSQQPLLNLLDTDPTPQPPAASAPAPLSATSRHRKT
eukprot:gene54102-37756_t